MTDADRTARTWHWKIGVARWTHRLELPPGASPFGELRRQVARLLPFIDDFATPVSAEWCTVSVGEDAAVMKDEPITSAALDEVFARLPDTAQFSLGLNLHCIAENGSECVLERAADITFDLDLPDPDGLEDGIPKLFVWFRLDVDIFAPVTSGQTDNRRLAALNAPRLKTFLRRLREEYGATLTDVDSRAGQGVSPDGFFEVFV